MHTSCRHRGPVVESLWNLSQEQHLDDTVSLDSRLQNQLSAYSSLLEVLVVIVVSLV